MVWLYMQFDEAIYFSYNSMGFGIQIDSFYFSQKIQVKMRLKNTISVFKICRSNSNLFKLKV